MTSFSLVPVHQTTYTVTSLSTVIFKYHHRLHMIRSSSMLSFSSSACYMLSLRRHTGCVFHLLHIHNITHLHRRRIKNLGAFITVDRLFRWLAHCGWAFSRTIVSTLTHIGLHPSLVNGRACVSHDVHTTRPLLPACFNQQLRSCGIRNVLQPYLSQVVVAVMF